MRRIGVFFLRLPPRRKRGWQATRPQSQIGAPMPPYVPVGNRPSPGLTLKWSPAGRPRPGVAASRSSPFRVAPTAPSSGSREMLMSSSSPCHLDPPGRFKSARRLGDLQGSPIPWGCRRPARPRRASFLGGDDGLPILPVRGSSFRAIATYGNKNDIKDKSNVSKCKVACCGTRGDPQRKDSGFRRQEPYRSASDSFPFRATPVGEDKEARKDKEAVPQPLKRRRLSLATRFSASSPLISRARIGASTVRTR